MERRRRLERLQLERDLENAADLFGVDDDDAGSRSASVSAVGGDAGGADGIYFTAIL